MRNNTKALALLACLTMGGTAAAQTDKADAATARTAEALTRIEAETLLLRARDRQLAVQVSILAKQNELAARQGEVDRAARPAEIVGEPVVRSIEGIGANRFATIELPGGGSIDVRPGDRFGKGMKVVAIRGSTVTVETAGKKQIQLNSVSAAATAPRLPAPHAGAAMPMFAPGAGGPIR